MSSLVDSLYLKLSDEILEQLNIFNWRTAVRSGGGKQTTPDVTTPPPPPEDTGDDDDLTEPVEGGEEEGWWIDRYMPLIENQVYTSKTKSHSIYINYNLMGLSLTSELVMYHLQEILLNYSKVGNQLYVNPQLGFFLYNNSGTKIEKYYHHSSNTSIFGVYRVLSKKTFSKLEKYVKKLGLKDFPFTLKMNANERSKSGFTLISNIVYCLIVI